MIMVRRFGTPVQERGQARERWYRWDLPSCTISARVDGRELVIDAYWNGNRESFRSQFLSRDSLFLWALGTHGRRRREYSDLFTVTPYSHLERLRFLNPREAESWLNTLYVS